MIKPTTLLYGIKPEMVICHPIAEAIFNEMGFSCVITSGVGKEHKKYSLHPVGYALDLRTKHIVSLSIKKKIVEKMKKYLPCCDVILEHVGEDQEHLHYEFDPKNDKKFQSDKQIYRQTGNWPE